jgi:3-oxoacyl-[acyl-carrier protein] reductase/meso-butanediol dehydrogenase/(S,S)-butanediol dehydrogenase/diacetyl reductase
MPSLSGKVAMVTGCSGERGIGRAIARRLAADGADLVLTSSGVRLAINKPTSGWGGLEAVAKEVRDAGQRALAVSLDVRSAAQVATAIDQAVQHFGRLDILVNNAAAPAGADRVPVAQLSEEAWDLVLDVNLKGTFLCSKAAANAMLSQQIKGRIINIGSDNSKVGQPRLAAYCASKFGLVGFTQALAMELAPAGITVNTVCPGPVDTERVDHFGRPEDGAYDAMRRAARITQLSAATPLGRLARPKDVADLTAFLASDEAEYITGQAINLVGGLIMH